MSREGILNAIRRSLAVTGAEDQRRKIVAERIEAHRPNLIPERGKGDTAHYVAYDKRDYRRRVPSDFRCGVTGERVSRDDGTRPLSDAPLAPGQWVPVRRRPSDRAWGRSCPVPPAAR